MIPIISRIFIIKIAEFAHVLFKQTGDGEAATSCASCLRNPLKKKNGLSACVEAPHILIIHVGGNDLGYTKGTGLIRRMRDDLALIMSLFPVTQMFSQISANAECG